MARHSRPTAGRVELIPEVAAKRIVGIIGKHAVGAERPAPLPLPLFQVATKPNLSHPFSLRLRQAGQELGVLPYLPLLIGESGCPIAGVGGLARPMAEIGHLQLEDGIGRQAAGLVVHRAQFEAEHAEGLGEGLILGIAAGEAEEFAISSAGGAGSLLQFDWVGVEFPADGLPG